MTSTRAVFFDAGHTLLYAHPDVGTVYAETTAALGFRLPPGRFTEVFLPAFRAAAAARPFGASDEEDYAMWSEITHRIHERLPELGGLDFDVWFDALYRKFGEPGVWKLYDDVEQVLRGLRARGLALGIVSNWDTRLRGICRGLGLDRLVDFIVISAEVGVRKPHPGIFEEALRRAGVRAEEAVHVGDLQEEDVEGAEKAGLTGFLIDRWKKGGAGPRVLGALEDLYPFLP